MAKEQASSLVDATLFSSLKGIDQLALAVSGGCDSVAMLFLLHGWARTADVRLYCFSVDHGLRQEAREEASFVRNICNQIGVFHDILYWHGDKPKTGIAAAARTARYHLLTQRCVELGLTHLALAHHKEDQLETLLMRLQRSNTGARGLAGMAPKTACRGTLGKFIYLHRPLLTVRRATLRTYLRTLGQNWIDDPSNQDQNFERVRVRNRLKQKPLFCADLFAYGQLSARYRTLTAQSAANFIEAHVTCGLFAHVRIDQHALSRLPDAIAVLVLQALLSMIGGRAHLPNKLAVRAALTSSQDRTLARVHIRKTKTFLFLSREHRNLPEPQCLKRGGLLWDQRYFLKPYQQDIKVYSGQCLPRNHRRLIEDDCEIVSGHPLTEVESAAFKAAPFLTQTHRDRLAIYSPFTAQSLGLCEFYPLIGSFERFCSNFDLPLQRALSSLLTKTPHLRGERESTYKLFRKNHL